MPCRGEDSDEDVIVMTLALGSVKCERADEHRLVEAASHDDRILRNR